MKPCWFAAAVLGLLLAAPPGGAAQQPDYLTPEEVTLVRDTQEPNKRILLFMKFAGERLLLFEKALAAPPGEAPPGEAPADPAARKDMLNNFIRAVDDTAEVLQTALDRGGIDLRKTRPLLIKSGAEFRKRLEQAQQTEPGQSEDLRYDLEDALMAAEDLAELAKKIPETPIPPKGPVVAGQEGKEEEAAPPPGKPTLKRRPEPPPKPK